MGKVYRYIDTRDNFIKYVGIIYGKNRTLEQRHREHIKNEIWCDENFKVQYLDIPVHNRSEAESLEAHFISLYKTGGWYNKSKSNWGQSSFIPEFDELDWQNFNYNLTSQDLENIKNKRINLNKNTNDSDLTNEKLNALSEKLDALIEINRNSFESINRAIMYSDSDFNNIRDQIHKIFSNEIGNINIRETITISCLKEINNKFNLITEKFMSLKRWCIFLAIMSFILFCGIMWVKLDKGYLLGIFFGIIVILYKCMKKSR